MGELPHWRLGIVAIDDCVCSSTLVSSLIELLPEQGLLPLPAPHPHESAELISAFGCVKLTLCREMTPIIELPSARQAGHFNLIVAVYRPQPVILDGSYKLPATKKAEWQYQSEPR